MEAYRTIVAGVIVGLTIALWTPFVQDHPLVMSLIILAMIIMLHKKNNTD